MTRRGLLASLPMFPAATAPGDARDGFAEAVLAGPRRLVLNGTGRCGGSWGGGESLVAALYLETRSQDTAAILQGPALVELRHRRSASLAQMVADWQDLLEDGLPPAFRAWLRPVRPGDVERQVFGPQGVRLEGEGRSIRDIPDPHFARQLLATWIGEAAPNAAMRRGLLGLES